VQQGQKKFPWVELPTQLIKIHSYFAGWPERCLPKMKREDRIDASTGPSQWSLKQKRAMEAQINKGAVKVLPRQPGVSPRSLRRFERSVCCRSHDSRPDIRVPFSLSPITCPRSRRHIRSRRRPWQCKGLDSRLLRRLGPSQAPGTAIARPPAHPPR
jgi:hypothetical protein